MIKCLGLKESLVPSPDLELLARNADLQGKCEYYVGNEERISSKYIQFPEAMVYEHIEKCPMTLIRNLEAGHLGGSVG